jgi:hypothetical protein
VQAKATGVALGVAVAVGLGEGGATVGDRVGATVAVGAAVPVAEGATEGDATTEGVAAVGVAVADGPHPASRTARMRDLSAPCVARRRMDRRVEPYRVIRPSSRDASHRSDRETGQR